MMGLETSLGSGRGHGVGQGGWFIAASCLGAFLLMAYPLPLGLSSLRPEFVCLTLIYWALVLPQRVGIAAAFGLGLLLDALESSPLGLHALSLSLVAYLCLKLHGRMRLFGLWQQAWMVGLVLAVHQGAGLALHRFAGIEVRWWAYIAPVLMSALLWPGIAIVLGYLQGRCRVS